MPPRKRPAAVPLENLAQGRERTGPYHIEFQRLPDLRSSRPLVDADRGNYEALMELRSSIVQKLGDGIDLRKAFFVFSQSGVDSAVTAVVHYILLREALRVSLAYCNLRVLGERVCWRLYEFRVGGGFRSWTCQVQASRRLEESNFRWVRISL